MPQTVQNTINNETHRHIGRIKRGDHMKEKNKMPSAEEIMKYEIADELGLTDKIRRFGWKSLTAKESGRIGGIIAKRKKDSRAGKKLQER